MAVLAKRSVPTRILGTCGYLVVFFFVLVMSTVPALLLSWLLYGESDAPPGVDLLLILGFAALGFKLLWPEFVARSFSQVALERDELVVHRWGHVHRWPLHSLRSFDASQHGFKVTSAKGQSVKVHETNSPAGRLLPLLATSAIADTLHRRLVRGETLTFRQPLVHLLGQEGPGVLTLTALAAAGLLVAGLPPLGFLALAGMAVLWLAWRRRNRWELVLTDEGFRGSDETQVSPWIALENLRAHERQMILVRQDRDLALTGGGELEPLRLLLTRRAREAYLEAQDATDDTRVPDAPPPEGAAPAAV